MKKQLVIMLICLCAASPLWALDKVPLPKKAAAGETIKDCAVCPEMVGIPAGSFEMGSNDGSSDEKPVYRVSVKKVVP